MTDPVPTPAVVPAESSPGSAVPSAAAAPAATAPRRGPRFRLSQLEALEAERATARFLHGWDCRCCNA